MKLFKNEKLEKVNEQLSKLETKKAGIENKISEMEKVLNQTYELYATQQVSDKDIDEAHAFLKERRQELSDIERMITRVEAVKNKVKLESVPFVKEARSKKIEAIQKKYDSKVSKVIDARNEFLKQLAALGQIKNEVKGTNNEFNDVMIELGENPDIYGLAINEISIISGGFTADDKCLGIKENVQKRAYAGDVPAWAAGDSE